MKSNEEMVNYLKETGRIKSRRIEEAFRKVDRARFVDRNPYVDRPARLVEDVTVSAPHIVAEMLELLQPKGSVLEMGSGSGYVQALLVHLCDEVVGVERIESLVESSRERVPEAEILAGDSAPEREFDRVLYSFAAPEEEIEKALEVNRPEILVAPVERSGRQVLRKYEDGEFTEEGYVRFVPRKEGVKGS